MTSFGYPSKTESVVYEKAKNEKNLRYHLNPQTSECGWKENSMTDDIDKLVRAGLIFTETF